MSPQHVKQMHGEGQQGLPRTPRREWLAGSEKEPGRLDWTGWPRSAARGPQTGLWAPACRQRRLPEHSSWVSSMSDLCSEIKMSLAAAWGADGREARSQGATGQEAQMSGHGRRQRTWAGTGVQSQQDPLRHLRSGRERRWEASGTLTLRWAGCPRLSWAVAGQEDGLAGSQGQKSRAEAVVTPLETPEASVSVRPEQRVHLDAVPDRRTAARGRRREGAGGRSGRARKATCSDRLAPSLPEALSDVKIPCGATSVCGVSR